MTQRLSLAALLMAQAVLVCGCTSALWDKDTFAHHYRSAVPNGLHLFYSEARSDILVQYDERKDDGTNTRPRCYWLEPNGYRVNAHRKPHFVSAEAVSGLKSVPVAEGITNPAQHALMGLYAVARRDDSSFTLYAGKEVMNVYSLPAYKGGSQRLKQVLLTPFTVAVDATIVGAIAGYYAAPDIFESLSQ